MKLLLVSPIFASLTVFLLSLLAGRSLGINEFPDTDLSDLDGMDVGPGYGGLPTNSSGCLRINRLSFKR